MASAIDADRAHVVRLTPGIGSLTLQSRAGA